MLFPWVWTTEVKFCLNIKSHLDSDEDIFLSGAPAFLHLIFFITSHWSTVITFEGKADEEYN